METQRRKDAKTQSQEIVGTGAEPGLSSEDVFFRANKAIPSSVRRLGAKPTAEREAKGEESLLPEPGADRTARTMCAGGRPEAPRNSSLRLCVSASLRYFLLRKRPVSGDGWTFPLRFGCGQNAVAVVFVSLVLVIGASGCASSPKTVPTEPTKPRSQGWTEKGDASWYGKPYHGRRTASGEIYDMHQMTAAHRSLPFQTKVRVERRDTGAKVEVRITDRGPFIKGRIIDLSLAAAKVIGLDIDGVAPVKIKVLGSFKKPRSELTETPRSSSNDDHCSWIQVGAFSSSNNAARAVDRLKDAGEKALAMEGPDGLERVRVGPFQSKNEATKALKRLVDEWPSARIVECGG